MCTDERAHIPDDLPLQTAHSIFYHRTYIICCTSTYQRPPSVRSYRSYRWTVTRRRYRRTLECLTPEVRRSAALNDIDYRHRTDHLTSALLRLALSKAERRGSNGCAIYYWNVTCRNGENDKKRKEFMTPFARTNEAMPSCI